MESENFVDILFKQTDKLYYKYLYKILSLMPGVDKTLFTNNNVKEHKEKN